jgi:hypothetical protein
LRALAQTLSGARPGIAGGGAGGGRRGARCDRSLKKLEDGGIPRQIPLVPDGFGQSVEPAERNQDPEEDNEQQPLMEPGGIG